MTVIRFLVAAWLAMLSPCLLASELPRMWEVTSGEGKFYVVGITHYGLDAEYDAYLQNKILPAYSTADVLAYEASVVFPATPKECSTPWPDTPDNAALLRMGRERVKALYLQMAREAHTKDLKVDDLDAVLDRIATQVAASYSEYGLAAAMKTYENSVTPLPGNRLRYGRGQITEYLLKQRPGIRKESVDTADEFIAAYCNIKESRPAYFRELIRNARFEHIDELTPSDVQAANDDFRASVTSGRIRGIYADQDAERVKSIVCERSANWLNKMLANQKKGIYFYALGFAHLIPSLAAPGQCKGLLRDLQDKGYAVRLIE